ncbi:hypothetical protein SAMN05444141_101175 [Pseudovibrio denitrificans]|uniref:Uncharacterized protein n=1 Tax=Pseudovibrio denitrificans TaxID=258256 RepID=A0A1I6XH06_9HYPH|nr:hypothetical protein SAMN05444141_101175 [Pseudovibrio denitrificans]
MVHRKPTLFKFEVMALKLSKSNFAALCGKSKKALALSPCNP